MKVSLQLIDVDQRYSPQFEMTVFRICQELLNNSVRHSQATETFVQLINHGEMLVLMVEDDGIGFDPGQSASGFGLRNIRLRAKLLNGTVEIDSTTGKGIVTTVEIPLLNSLPV